MRRNRGVTLCVIGVFLGVLYQLFNASSWTLQYLPLSASISIQTDTVQSVSVDHPSQPVLSQKDVSNRTHSVNVTSKGLTPDPIPIIDHPPQPILPRNGATVSNRTQAAKIEGKGGTIRRVTRISSTLPPTNLSSIVPRVFDSWPRNQSLPCFPPEKNWFHHTVLRSPADTGLLFIKPMKTGGSTAAGVHVRLARHVARRQEQSSFEICKGRWDHTWAHTMFPNRIRQKSFLWTVVREPTARAVSQFFHFQVSRENVTAEDKSFQRHLTRQQVHWNYYLRLLSTTQIFVSSETAVDIINKIMADYDFIAVTERMDESVVVLMMLLNLQMADVLYLSAKGNGKYDDGAHNDKCYFIQPSVVSPGMKDFFKVGLGSIKFSGTASCIRRSIGVWT
jgi:hypothetical protein